MGVFAGEATMLYCPKCRQTYEDGSQRFCSNEGSRLLPALTGARHSDDSQGVFSSLLTRKTQSETPAKNFPPAPNTPTEESKQVSFNPPNAELPKNEEKSLKAKENFQVFELELDEDEISLEIRPIFVPKAEETKKIQPEIKAKPAPVVKTEPVVQSKKEAPAESPVKVVANGTAQGKIENRSETVPVETKPPVRVVKPHEVPSGLAELGDPMLHPRGRSAVSAEKPRILIGQTLKGRYKIIHLLGEDPKNLIYLAEDVLAENKKVVLRVLMQTNDEDLTYKLLVEERVALSHIKHPNVAALIDSGELTEGKPFIVTEYFGGDSVEQKLAKSGSFDVRRAARIIRQASYALSEVHQNGVLHRALRPHNLIMTVNGGGTEQVKVTDFAISDGWKTEKDFAYIAPEQLEEKPAIFAGDIYSLGVIAFQMLTNRLPFDAASEDVLRRQQKLGLKLKASDLRLGVSTAVDEILEKALAYNPAERFPKARDFGDAFFNALVNPAAPAVSEKAINEITEPSETADYTSIKSPAPDEKSNAPETLPWENRSPDPLQVGGKSWMLVSILGLVVLLGGLWAIWYYFLNRPTPQSAPQSTTEQLVEPVPNQPNAAAKTPSDIEVAPPERKNILQPPNTAYFQNTRENLQGELAKNYRGFSFFYPNDWKIQTGGKQFVDVAKRNNDDLVEQMLVTFYESKGTFSEDLPKFQSLVDESNKRLAEQNKTYRFVSAGAGEINGGWKVYEMKFEAEIRSGKGEPLKLYGRRIFMPAMQKGVKTGFVITMLATSLSPDVKSADDIGVKGDLKTVLETFEPMQAY